MNISSLVNRHFMSYSDKISQVEVNMEYRQENTIFDKSEICEVL